MLRQCAHAFEGTWVCRQAVDRLAGRRIGGRRRVSDQSSDAVWGTKVEDLCRIPARCCSRRRAVLSALQNVGGIEYHALISKSRFAASRTNVSGVNHIHLRRRRRFGSGRLYSFSAALKALRSGSPAAVCFMEQCIFELSMTFSEFRYNQVVLFCAK